MNRNTEMHERLSLTLKLSDESLCSQRLFTRDNALAISGSVR